MTLARVICGYKHVLSIELYTYLVNTALVYSLDYYRATSTLYKTV